MGRKETEYMRGREDGLDLAARIVRKEGLQGLEDELRFRGITGINTSLARKDLDIAAEQIKIMALNTLKIAVVAVLHDEFGFGEKRVQKCMAGIDKFSEYLDKGWLCWLDVIQEIKDRLNLDMSFTEGDGTLPENYSRPDPRDVWADVTDEDEPDLVGDYYWKEILKLTGFSEFPSTQKKNVMVVMNDTQDEGWEYEDRYDKLELYDFLNGVAYAQKHYAVGKEN